MNQQWLSVIGLTLDIVGFLLIVWEWSRGFREEWRERHRSDALLGAAYFGVDRGAVEGRKRATDHEMRARAWRFGIGFALVICGFGLQLLGNLPGGIPALGIHPG